MYGGERCRLAGYCAKNGHPIPVSVPKRAGSGRGGWIMDCGAVPVIPSGAGRFWYVNENDLKK